MDNNFPSLDKDEILRDAFSKLASRDVSSKWAKSSHPFTELRAECALLMNDSSFRKDLKDYLASHQIIARAIEMFFNNVGVSARDNWKKGVPEKFLPFVARGWFLGRWLPTFLIIDGPIGRFICKGGSPLFEKLKSQYQTYPLLASARDFLNNDLFTKLRNGFAHWAFDWIVVENESYIVSYDWQTDALTAKLHQEKADAFYIIAVQLILIVFEVIIMCKPS